MPKTFKVRVTRSTMNGSRETIWEGTVEYLVDSVFGYTLECGASWNRKINPRPKTIGALIKALNASYNETSGGYSSSYAEQIK